MLNSLYKQLLITIFGVTNKNSKIMKKQEKKYLGYEAFEGEECVYIMNEEGTMIEVKFEVDLIDGVDGTVATIEDVPLDLIDMEDELKNDLQIYVCAAIIKELDRISDFLETENNEK